MAFSSHAIVKNACHSRLMWRFQFADLFGIRVTVRTLFVKLVFFLFLCLPVPGGLGNRFKRLASQQAISRGRGKLAQRGDAD
jgi:hypothetical protein